MPLTANTNALIQELLEGFPRNWLSKQSILGIPERTFLKNLKNSISRGGVSYFPYKSICAIAANMCDDDAKRQTLFASYYDDISVGWPLGSDADKVIFLCKYTGTGIMRFTTEIFGGIRCSNILKERMAEGSINHIMLQKIDLIRPNSNDTKAMALFRQVEQSLQTPKLQKDPILESLRTIKVPLQRKMAEKDPFIRYKNINCLLRDTLCISLTQITENHAQKTNARRFSNALICRNLFSKHPLYQNCLPSAALHKDFTELVEQKLPDQYKGLINIANKAFDLALAAKEKAEIKAAKSWLGFVSQNKAPIQSTLICA